MSKINDLTVYAIESPVNGNDYWIGTRGSDKKTRNFSAVGVAQYVAEYLGLSGNVSTGLISVLSITVDELLVNVQQAVYRIFGTEYGPVSGFITVDAASDGFYRTDIIVGNEYGGLQLIEGIEDETTAIQPTTPNNTVLIGVISVFGAEIVPEIPEPNFGWKFYNNLAYLKRQGNTNPNKIQGGDPVWGVMSDNITLLKGAPYKGTGNYMDAANYYANPDDISGQPATNTPL